MMDDNLINEIIEIQKSIENYYRNPEIIDFSYIQNTFQNLFQYFAELSKKKVKCFYPYMLLDSGSQNYYALNSCSEIIKIAKERYNVDFDTIKNSISGNCKEINWNYKDNPKEIINFEIKFLTKLKELNRPLIQIFQTWDSIPELKEFIFSNYNNLEANFQKQVFKLLSFMIENCDISKKFYHNIIRQMFQLAQRYTVTDITSKIENTYSDSHIEFIVDYEEFYMDSLRNFLNFVDKQLEDDFINSVLTYSNLQNQKPKNMNSFWKIMKIEIQNTIRHQYMNYDYALDEMNEKIQDDFYSDDDYGGGSYNSWNYMPKWAKRERYKLNKLVSARREGLYNSIKEYYNDEAWGLLDLLRKKKPEEDIDKIIEEFNDNLASYRAIENEYDDDW